MDGERRRPSKTTRRFRPRSAAALGFDRTGPSSLADDRHHKWRRCVDSVERGRQDQRDSICDEPRRHHSVVHANQLRAALHPLYLDGLVSHQFTTTILPSADTTVSTRTANKIGRANCRPASPVAAGRQFGITLCAPAFLSATIAHLCRSPAGSATGLVERQTE